MSQSNSFYEQIWEKDKSVDYYSLFSLTPVFQRQEEAFRQVIRKIDRIRSVLELGIGFGRITKIMLQEFPEIMAYVGVDISMDQINAANKFLGPEYANQVAFVKKNIMSYIDDRKYDLVLASEILLHIRPEHIKEVVEKMVKYSRRTIIHIDWARDYEPSDWCFLHDYYKLFTEAGATLVEEVKTDRQSIWRWQVS